MSTRKRSEPTLLNLEFKLAQLPPEFVSAVKFADAHDLQILVGYVEDEGRVYLMTVEVPA